MQPGSRFPGRNPGSSSPGAPQTPEKKRGIFGFSRLAQGRHLQDKSLLVANLLDLHEGLVPVCPWADPRMDPHKQCRWNVIWIQATKSFQRLNTAREATSWRRIGPGKSKGGEVCVGNINPWINLLETGPQQRLPNQAAADGKKERLHLIWVHFSSLALEIFHIEQHQFCEMFCKTAQAKRGAKERRGCLDQMDPGAGKGRNELQTLYPRTLLEGLPVKG